MIFGTLPLTDTVASFALVFLMLLIAPTIMERFKLPGMVGMILAGALIGPHGIGLLAREGSVEFLGSIGIIYIMFLAGVETDLGVIRKTRAQGLVFGLLTFGIPFAVGFVGGTQLLGMSVPAAVLFGSLFSSHTLLPYPIVSRLGLTRIRATATAVTATIITDVLAMLVLAVISSGAAGSLDIWFWLRLTGLTLLLVLVSMLVVPRLAAFFFQKSSTDGRREFVFVMAILFVLAYVSKLAGLEPIIGAFAAGLALNATIPEKSLLMNRISFAGNAVFIPFFLVSTGMLVDIRAFATYDLTLIATVFMVAAILVTKFAASFLNKPFFGYRMLEVTYMFGLTVNQAAATLVAVLVGFKLGLFGVPVLTGTIVMIIITCLLGPLITQATSRRLVLAKEAEESSSSDFKERPIVMVSNPEHSTALIDLASFLSPKHSTEVIYPVNIVRDSADAERDLVASERMLAQVVVHGVSTGLNLIPVTRIALNPADGVSQLAQELRATTVIAGAGPETETLFQKRPFGRVIEQIVNLSRQMILVSRLRHAIASYTTFVLVVPPLAERHEGFPRACHSIGNLIGHLNAKLVVCGLSGSLEPIRKSIEREGYLKNAEYVQIEGWEQLGPSTQRPASSGTAYFFVNVRKGSLSWQPAVDRIPLRLLEFRPDASFLCIYLGEQESGSGLETKQSDSGDKEMYQSKHDESQDLFSQASAMGRVKRIGGAPTLEIAVLDILDGTFADNRGRLKALSQRIIEVADSEPVEMHPGTVLLHAHVAEVDGPLVFFAYIPVGLPLPKLPEPVTTVVVLLVPESQPPEEHLKVLASIARIVMNQDFPDRLSGKKDI